MKVHVSDHRPEGIRPGEFWKKSTGEYRKFTGGGWVPPSEAEMAEIRAAARAETEVILKELDNPLTPKSGDKFTIEELDKVGERLKAVGFQLTHANLTEGTADVVSLDGNVGQSCKTPLELYEFLDQLEILAAKKELSADDISKLAEGHDANGGHVS